jgi:predicted nucleic acid-binding protein
MLSGFLMKVSLTGDADDQKFIDLAIAHQALLLSMDQPVISMRKRLLAQGIRAQAAI